MSSKNRVNPDHYRQAGVDFQGETVTQQQDKQRLAREVAARRWTASSKLIPGGEQAPGQKAAKVGVVASSQKAATSHSGTRSMAATRAVPGAFGRERAGFGDRRSPRKASPGTRRTGKAAARGKSTARRKSAMRSRAARRALAGSRPRKTT
jgi:hypothetical protein